VASVGATMTLRTVLSVIGLVCGALVTASGASASIVFTVSGFSNEPGTATLAILQLQVSATNPDTTVDVASLPGAIASGFTAPAGAPLSFVTSVSGSVGQSGVNGFNALSVVGTFDRGLTSGMETLTPDITSSGSFSDGCGGCITFGVPLTGPFSLELALGKLTLGPGATVDLLQWRNDR